MFKRWDPRALHAYINGGLEGVDKGQEQEQQVHHQQHQRPARLKCKPESEAGFYRGAGASVWPKLFKLGATRPVTFVAGEHSEHMSAMLLNDQKGGSGADAARMLVGMMGTHARLVVVPKGSHFVVMEDVALVAGLVWERVLEAIGGKDSSSSSSGGSSAAEEGGAARSSL